MMTSDERLTRLEVQYEHLSQQMTIFGSSQQSVLAKIEEVNSKLGQIQVEQIKREYGFKGGWQVIIVGVIVCAYILDKLWPIILASLIHAGQ